MADFDQAARTVAELEAGPLLAWLAARAGLVVQFREWFSERTPPRAGSAERIADQVALLDDPARPEQPWLFVLEFMTAPDAGKLDVTLEEAATLRSRARWGLDRRRRFNVLTALIHLTGRAPETDRDMRTPAGFGTFHRPLIWDIETEDASAILDAVTSATQPVALLYWLPLMTRGGEEIIITRWREAIAALVPDRQCRADVVYLALTFAELARNYLAWERGLEGLDVGDSIIATRMRDQGRMEGSLVNKRQYLVELVNIKFPGAMSAEVRLVIEQQESGSVLDDWFRAAARSATYDDFLADLRR